MSQELIMTLIKFGSYIVITGIITWGVQRVHANQTNGLLNAFKAQESVLEVMQGTKVTPQGRVRRELNSAENRVPVSADAN